MGFFEFFTTSNEGKEEKLEKKKRFKKKTEKNVGNSFNGTSNSWQGQQNQQQINAQNTIQTFSPKSFEEVSMIIDNLCNGYPAIVKVDELDSATAQRVIDLLSGAIHAIKGNVSLVSNQTFVFTPAGTKTN